MFLATNNSAFKPMTLEELLNLVNQRAIQIILLCLISLFLCQIFKFVFSSIKSKKMAYRELISTGGFPSSHTTICITLVLSMFFFQLHDLGGRIDWSFAVAVIFAIITIYDAMGLRLEASKHAKILNELTSEMPEEKKKELGFNKKMTLKERLGHKGVEVFGGIVFGSIVAVVGYYIILAI